VFIPRTGASSASGHVIASPLLRAITEQQSMEEREAANYMQSQLAIDFTSAAQDFKFEQRLPSDELDDDAVSSQLGWTYVDYMKAAGLHPGECQ